MNQGKIGKFIVEQRKIQKLTQEQLAEKLNVSKNAVSKWERGINLPDVSIMKDLCCILDITLNEFFAGEKIQIKESLKKTDESIVNAINYTNNRANKKINKVIIFGASVTVILVILLSMILIDVGRMSQNKTVIFSTWGFDYFPPVDLENERIEIAIINHLVLKGDSGNKHHENEKTFVSMKIYLIDEMRTEINVYAWVLNRTYYMEKNEVKQDSGSSMAYKFVMKKINDEYEVVDLKNPRDGSYYVEDMKKIFPKNVRKEMDKVHYDGTIERLQLDIDKQVKLYFH